MGVLKVNPAAESKSDFPTFQPGTYRMRIKSCEDRSPEKQDYKLTLEFANVTQLVKLDGSVYTGSAEGAGSMFDYVQQDPEKQWKLRQLTEAAGLPWADYDPCVELVGKEVDVKLGTEEYQGEQKNKVKRYLLPK